MFELLPKLAVPTINILCYGEEGTAEFDLNSGSTQREK